jgi:hypothetical protein
MKVFGPDGRAWTITRRPDPPGLFRSITPGGSWIVEATAPDETRRWEAPTRRTANELVTEVALALRTGAEGPAGELPPEMASVDDDRSDEGPPEPR